MRGLSYYDEKWDTLLDQIDYSSSEMTQHCLQTPLPLAN